LGGLPAGGRGVGGEEGAGAGFGEVIEVGRWFAAAGEHGSVEWHPEDQAGEVLRGEFGVVDLQGPMRDSPMWAGMEQVAHTLAYDGRVVNGFRLRGDRLAAVDTPTLVMDGGQTPWISSGADALADALPNSTHRRLEGQQHGPSPDVIAPVLIEFFAAA
jgi:hypothetical protein